MTPAQEILKLIETVDPTDSAKLDDIDARVWCYVSQINEFDEDVYLSCGVEFRQARISIKYTRSRDALKAIRPEGYWIEIKTGSFSRCEWFQCKMEGDCDPHHPHINAKNLRTEELAELHAIIQAIEFERTQKEVGVDIIRDKEKT